MVQERRQFVRVNLRLAALLKNLTTGKVRRTLTKDLGAGGMRFVTEELLTPGVRLDVEVKLPDREEPVRFTAEVVWSRPIGQPRKSYENPTAETGIKFVKIDPKDQALIKQYAAITASPSPRS